MNDKRWDVFISHASEDKETVARPLAGALGRAGARVWLDEHELKLGDSLSGKIDHGLASSRFGVVVLSPSFLAKHWPKRELAGLRAMEEDGRKIILPVWHQVDKATVARSSPVLADLLAISTSEGIDKVASAILEIIFAPGSGSPSLDHPRVSRRLFELLASEPSKKDFLAFLQAHPKLVAHLLRSLVTPLWRVQVAGVDFDAAALSNLGTTRVPTLNLVSFLPLWTSPFLEATGIANSEVVSLEPQLVEALENGRRLLANYGEDASASEFNEIRDRLAQAVKEDNPEEDFWDIPPLIEITVFAGRRRYVDASRATARAWREYRASDRSCILRTYDGIIDAFDSIERSQEAGFGLGSWDFRDFRWKDDPA